MPSNVELQSMPLDSWRETKTTLHLFTQIAGKIRLALHPKLNHWWHVPFYASPRGLTTGSIPYRHGNFEIEFDFVADELVIRSSDGATSSFSLSGQSVKDFYKQIMAMLDKHGINVSIDPRPFDPARCGSDVPFNQDTRQREYDPDAVRQYWHIVLAIDEIFKRFRSRFVGKCSPVHLFWHSFDLAVTRFSGRPAEVSPDADPVTKEAYSHEVISAGLWPGDENLPEPAFYCYVHPEPDSLADEPLRPENAWWQPNEGTHMALFKYEDFRSAANPEAALLDFLQSAYEAGAKRANWPRAELEAS